MKDSDNRLQIPLFPLHTVLFPGGLLPLQIFEPRYLSMISACMKSDEGFGVVLIRDGNEVGEAAEIHDIGTKVRIVDWDQLDNGLLGISCVGTQRFKVLSSQTDDAELLTAEVELLGDKQTCAVPDEYQELVQLCQRLWKQESDRLSSLPTAFNDAAWVSERLLEFLPLPLKEKQHYLQLNDPLEALRYLAPLTGSVGTA